MWHEILDVSFLFNTRYYEIDNLTECETRINRAVTRRMSSAAVCFFLNFRSNLYNYYRLADKPRFAMWVVYALLFLILYAVHCNMARNLLRYYTARDHPFHWNLHVWNQDVRNLVDSLD